MLTCAMCQQSTSVGVGPYTGALEAVRMAVQTGQPTHQWHADKSADIRNLYNPT